MGSGERPITGVLNHEVPIMPVQTPTQRITPALNGGPHFKFNEAISLVVRCRDQQGGGLLLGSAEGGR